MPLTVRLRVVRVRDVAEVPYDALERQQLCQPFVELGPVRGKYPIDPPRHCALELRRYRFRCDLERATQRAGAL